MTLDLERVRRRLNDRRRQLLARYQGAIDRVEQERGAREIEMEDNAADLWDARVNSVLSDTDARAIEAVTGSLIRLDEGAYGRCLSCGEWVDEARLDALPETPLCAACADATEAPRMPPVGLA